MALDLVGVGQNDVVYDLGCGDGRVAVKAAVRGAEAVCVEIDRVLCNVAEVFSRVFGVGERVRVVCGDMFSIDMRSLEKQPTVVYLYHYPSTLAVLGEKLKRELDLGVLVVSLDAPIKGWRPLAVIPVIDSTGSIWLVWLYLTGWST